MPRRKSGAADGGEPVSSEPERQRETPLTGAEAEGAPPAGEAAPPIPGEPLPPEPPAEPEAILPAEPEAILPAEPAHEAFAAERPDLPLEAAAPETALPSEPERGTPDAETAEPATWGAETTEGASETTQPATWAAETTEGAGETAEPAAWAAEAPTWPERDETEANQDRDIDTLIVPEPASDTTPEPAAAGGTTGSLPPSEPLAAGPAAAPAHDEHHEHEEHEEEGSSFAARALTLLLVLLAGAGLGIWAAPRVAPMLPSGMAPVADWLTPGRSEAEARIAALEERLNTGLTSVESRLAEVPASADLDTRIGAAVTAAEGRLDAGIAAVRQALDESDGAQAARTLARLQSTLDGQAAELATLKEQISGAVGEAGNVSAEALSQIDVYRGELEGLRAEVGTVRDNVAALSARLEEVATAANRQIETAQARVEAVETQAAQQLSAAQIDADLAQIRSAIAAGQPFAEPLDRLASQPGVTVPQGLADAAPSGVATFAALRDGYPDAAHAAIRASIQASAGDGVLARTRAFFQSQVASRSLEPREGVGTDAVLSRIEERLAQDDLQGALAAAEALPSEAAAAMQDWLGAARTRAQAAAGLESLGSSLPATN